MLLEDEINYDALINRAIPDFKPATRLWPVKIRLFFWILFEAAILASTEISPAHHQMPARDEIPDLLLTLGLPISASIAAAFFALRGAVPGREVTRLQLIVLIVLVAAALATPSASFADFAWFPDGEISVAELIGVAALPWWVLIWAVRRGVPVQPAKTGMIIGLAAFSFAVAVLRLVDYGDDSALHLSWLAVSVILLVAFSTLAGKFWLDWISIWQSCNRSDAAGIWITGYRIAFPAAITASLITFVFVLAGVSRRFLAIPDFDRTIEIYDQSIAAGFRSNVPSGSLDTVVTAYVERGMPAYMWDFGPEGFKFAGGRWQPLPDGTPVTYTWFHAAKGGGLICMMRQTDTFKPPPAVHKEYHHFLFYRYRGFSFCLINIGGYGNFISVIGAPMPLRQFVLVVLAAVG